MADVVVGGGSAGAVVAARLAEDRTVRVLLLEAGPERDQLVRPPMHPPAPCSAHIPSLPNRNRRVCGRPYSSSPPSPAAPSPAPSPTSRTDGALPGLLRIAAAGRARLEVCDRAANPPGPPRLAVAARPRPRRVLVHQRHDLRPRRPAYVMVGKAPPGEFVSHPRPPLFNRSSTRNTQETTTIGPATAATAGATTTFSLTLWCVGPHIREPHNATHSPEPCPLRPRCCGPAP